MPEKKRPSSGTCNQCGGAFAKAAMTRHLGGCKKLASSATTQTVQSFHVLVEGGHRNIYWLHLAVPQRATLSALDRFLRRIWLECCGHMSAFTIGGLRYAAAPMEDEFGSGLRENSMRPQVKQALQVGTRFSHEYDYGSTTELSLGVLGELETCGKPGEIQLLARNDHPKIACNDCGTAATQVCCQCIWDGNGWVCDSCAEDHECGPDMLLPAVNSPRAGVCGYTG